MTLDSTLLWHSSAGLVHMPGGNDIPSTHCRLWSVCNVSADERSCMLCTNCPRLPWFCWAFAIFFNLLKLISPPEQSSLKEHSWLWKCVERCVSSNETLRLTVLKGRRKHQFKLSNLPLPFVHFGRAWIHLSLCEYTCEAHLTVPTTWLTCAFLTWYFPTLLVGN